MTKGIDYTKTLLELEAIVGELQNSTTSLDEAIALHEKGKHLVTALEEYLKDAKIVINKRVASEE